MNPQILAASASAVGNLVGGFINRSDARADRAMNQRNIDNARSDQSSQYERSFREGQRQFNEIHFNSILNRSRDAKRAGLHPLAALGIAPGGATGAPGASAVIGGQHNSGSALGDGVSRAGAALGEAVRAGRGGPSKADAAFQALAAQTQLAQQRLYRSQARYYDSMGLRALSDAARTTQTANSTGRDVSHSATVDRQSQKGRPLPDGSVQSERETIAPPAYHSRTQPGSLSTRYGKWHTSKRNSNAEEMELRYGDVGSAVYGLWKILDDLGHNIGLRVPVSTTKRKPRGKTPLERARDRLRRSIHN